MMKETVLFTVILLALLTPLHSRAQWSVGVQGGIHIPTQPGIRPTRITAHESVQATGGVFGELSAGWMALRAGASYEYQQVQLGQIRRIHVDGTLLDVSHDYQNIHWLVLPALLRIQTGDRAFRPYGLLGINLRIRLSARYDAALLAPVLWEAIRYDGRADFNNTIDVNTTAVDLTAGAGVGHEVADGMSTFLEIRYIHSVTPLYVWSTTDFSAIRALQLSAGLMLNL